MWSHLAVVHICVLGEVLENTICDSFSLSYFSFLAVVKLSSSNALPFHFLFDMSGAIIELCVGLLMNFTFEHNSYHDAWHQAEIPDLHVICR